jgi:uncharacterized membrane protein
MEGCLALVIIGVSVVLLIAPLVSLGLSLQMRSRLRALESELRTLRGRFDARDRREAREQAAEDLTPRLTGEPLAPKPETAPQSTAEPAASAAPGVEDAPVVFVPATTRVPAEPPEELRLFAGGEGTTEDESGLPPSDSDAEFDEAVGEIPPVEPPAHAAATRSTEERPEAPTPDVAFPPPSSEPPPATTFDWEGLVGIKLFSWIAGIALALAAVFFLKYSIDHGWLSPTIRLIAGLVTGVGLIAVCEAKFASGYRVTANALDASGIAILYATIFAAHDLWKLVSQPMAFVLMVVVTAVAVVLATRRGSAFIALLGLLGGFATPALLSTGQDSPFSLFGYLLILNAGVAWVAWKKSWPVLSLLSLGFTTLYQWVWVVKFLDGPRVPIAIGVFLVFPIAAVMMIWIAKAKEPEKSSRLFEWTAQAGALLPLLFAFYGAAVPAFGERVSLLFFFLLVVDAGLAIVVLAGRMPGILHLLGGVSTVLVLALWFGLSWTSAAWPSILGWISAFVVLYALVPELARRLGRELDGAALSARYAAPVLLFVFPALAALEPRAGAMALFFGVLFVLTALLGFLAVRQDATWLWVPAALVALGALGQWAGEHLSAATLDGFLVVCGLFTALLVAIPVAAANLGRRLADSRAVSLPLVGVVLVMFATVDSLIAGNALIAVVVIVSVAFVGLQLLGGRNGRKTAVVAAALLAWLLFAALWTEVNLDAVLVRAVVGVAAFALVIVLGSIGQAEGRSRARGDSAIWLALFVYPFLWAVAGSNDLAGRAIPILSLLAFVTVLFAVGAIWSRMPGAQLVAAGLTQVTLVVWCATLDSWRLTLVAILAAVVAGFFAFAVWRAAARIGARGIEQHAAAVIASTLAGHFVPIAAAAGDWNVDWPVLVMAHLALLLITFTTAWKTEWHGVAIVAVFPTALAYFWWGETAAAETGTLVRLAFAAALYLPFVVYPLALGARAGRSIRPYLGAIVASVPFFFFAKDALDAISFGFIAVLPLAQAGLLAVLLAKLLSIEPEGSRASGRLALVAGTMLAFVTVAIPLQLDKEWITIGWALEAVALVWLFRRIPHPGLLGTAAGLFAVVLTRLVLNPAVFDYHPRSAVPIFNWYLYTYLVPAAAMFAVPYLLEASSVWTRRFRNACSVGGTILLFLLLNIEIADFYSEGAGLTFDFDAGLAQDLTYTIGWALFAIALLVAGLVKELRAARIASLALLVVAIAKCFLHDLMRLGGLYRVGSLVGLAVSLAVVALLLQRFVFREKKEATPSE